MSKRTIHRLYVEKGYEDCPEVMLAYGQLIARHGRDNVELVVEEAPREEDPDAHDLAGRRSVLDPTGED